MPTDDENPNGDTIIPITLDPNMSDSVSNNINRRPFPRRLDPMPVIPNQIRTFYGNGSLPSNVIPLESGPFMKPTQDMNVQDTSLKFKSGATIKKNTPTN